jgi:XapX domain-containing protein
VPHILTYLISLDAGVLVGIIYGLINVRSPAPPLVALVGVLGILVGEQIILVGKQLLAGSAYSAAWREARCTSHMFGMLPGRHADEAKISATDFSEKRT